jgi:hypothetical protein
VKVYIAGPMTGIKDFNYPAFFAAEQELLHRGYEVISPTVITDNKIVSKEDAKSWDYYMREAIKLLVTCDAIFLLPDWQLSRRARLEFQIANDLGFQILT